MITMLDFLTAANRRAGDTLRSLGRLFTTMLILSLSTTWLLFAGVVYESYVNTWNSAGAFASNVKALISLDLARTIELYDLSLKAAAEGFADPDLRALPVRVRRMALFDQSANAPGLGAISIYDSTGALVADSRMERVPSDNAAGRDYFSVHAAASAGLYFSHPFQSHLHDDVWTVALSRRISNADGSFAGVVVGTLKLSYFVRLFGAVDMPAESVITLVQADGTILMRSRLMDIGRDLNRSQTYRDMMSLHAGEFVRVSQVDYINRLYHFGPVDHLPLLLVVGLPVSDFLATWRWRMVFIALGFAILSGFIGLLAVALGRELHRRTLAEGALLELAATDGMTGLANRRHFDEVLEREWARAAREGSSVALLMVDHDFFKAYNDNYGHLQGDEALKAVARLMRTAMRRPADLVARYGGEEFAILMPETDLAGAIQVAETLRLAVSGLAWGHVRSPFGHLTVSVGVAACRPTAARHRLSLVKAADAALYQAKDLGRNQVVADEPQDLAEPTEADRRIFA